MKNILYLFLASVLLFQNIMSQEKRPLTFKDIMQFKQIKNPELSQNGNWVLYSQVPDRGNPELIIRDTKSENSYLFVRAAKPEISKNETWLKFEMIPDFADLEKDKPSKKTDLVLFNLSKKDTLKFNEIKSSGFSENSNWLAIHFKNVFGLDTTKTKLKKHIGTSFILRNLISGKEDTIGFVSSFAFDSLSNYMACTVSDTSVDNNGLYIYNLSTADLVQADVMKNSSVSNLTWKNKSLAYTISIFDKKGKTDSSDLKLWNGKVISLAESKSTSDNMYIPHQNKLEWSKDGKKLFFGYKYPLPVKSKIDTSNKDIFDFDSILKKNTLQVWHWNDPLIKTNEREEWKNKKKELFKSLYDFDAPKIVKLTDKEVPSITFKNTSSMALGKSDIPYQKFQTWDGIYNDYYTINLKTGERDKVLEKLYDEVDISPKGGFIVYYDNSNWLLYNVKTESTINLTEKLETPFANEDHDYPSAPPGYGIAGWMENDVAVLIYDKYDIWKFDCGTGAATCLTAGYGRIMNLTLRIVNLDKEKLFFRQNEKLLLSAFHNSEKYTAIYETVLNKSGVVTLLREPKKFTVLSKAKKGDPILFTRETYDEFPDLWITTDNFKTKLRLSNLDKQRDPFLWGKAELIDFKNIDGYPLQGVVIKPDNFDPKKKYPVLVYYYRFFSERVHEFNDMVVNHRPNFPFYAGNDYIVFLPDIHFEVGNPGFSAAKCLVPGVQKLIDLGWADSAGIALHGHSWSGYQTAFVITLTDKFACAIAGAPVANMTSAYSGIRWGTGLARQFQYEKGQSRIGASLWEKPSKYIENSPVFFADKINTPLLIEFGDKDDAVPWYQGIELYLAMRRLEKDCVFLQYEDEPHHLKKYANKLDYSIKMKEYIDHYCKGTPAPLWLKEGVPYIGD